MDDSRAVWPGEHSGDLGGGVRRAAVSRHKYARFGCRTGVVSETGAYRNVFLRPEESWISPAPEPSQCPAAADTLADRGLLGLSVAGVSGRVYPARRVAETAPSAGSL